MDLQLCLLRVLRAESVSPQPLLAQTVTVGQASKKGLEGLSVGLISLLTLCLCLCDWLGCASCSWLCLGEAGKVQLATSHFSCKCFTHYILFSSFEGNGSVTGHDLVPSLVGKQVVR